VGWECFAVAIALFLTGVIIVEIRVRRSEGTRPKRERRGFEVKLITGEPPVPRKEERD
jgi:hypothetical protein